MKILLTQPSIQFASYVMRTHWGLQFSQGFTTPPWPLGHLIAVLNYSALETTLNFSCVNCMGVLLIQFSSILRSTEALIFILRTKFNIFYRFTENSCLIIEVVEKDTKQLWGHCHPTRSCAHYQFHWTSHAWFLPSEHRSPANIKPT